MKYCRLAASRQAEVATYWPPATEGVPFPSAGKCSAALPKTAPSRTPLATLHKFNGFADIFLTTPPDGLVDLYATVSGKVQAFSWTVTFHDFDSDAGPASYGSELDAGSSEVPAP